MPRVPANLTRNTLAQIAPSQRALIALEQLLQQVNEVGPDALAEVGIAADMAGSRAQEAVDAISRLASAIELLALAPQQGQQASDDDVAPPMVSVMAADDVAPQPAQYIPPDDVSPPETPNELIDAPLVVGDNLTLPKTAGKGIRIDKVSPSFGWRDMLGQIAVKTTGVNEPDWVVYRGTIYGYTFTNGAHYHEAGINYHIPHDYVPGTDLHVHVHWSQKVVDTGGTAGAPGVAKWYFDITYADGHGTAGGAADPFPATITQSVTQQASTTQYGHMIAEVQFTSDGGSATTIDRNTIRVDGLILLRIYRDSSDASDTLNQDPFVHMVDVHYQSTNLGTKQKSPDFYT